MTFRTEENRVYCIWSCVRSQTERRRKGGGVFKLVTKKCLAKRLRRASWQSTHAKMGRPTHITQRIQLWIGSFVLFAVTDVLGKFELYDVNVLLLAVCGCCILNIGVIINHC